MFHNKVPEKDYFDLFHFNRFSSATGQLDVKLFNSLDVSDWNLHKCVFQSFTTDGISRRARELYFSDRENYKSLLFRHSKSISRVYVHVVKSGVEKERINWVFRSRISRLPDRMLKVWKNRIEWKIYLMRAPSSLLPLSAAFSRFPPSSSCTLLADLGFIGI